MLPSSAVIGRPASPRIRRSRASNVRKIALPRIARPRLRVPRLGLPRVPRTIWIVALVVSVLLIAPLAYVLSSRPAAARHSSARVATTSTASAAAGSAQAAAIRGVESATGLRYAGSCPANAACLSVLSQMVGQDAAAVLFSTASSGGRQCAGYVYRSGGGWHFLDAVCGLAGQLSPLVGHEATVHVSGSCANLRDRASLNAGVVACLADGAQVHIDGGPTYADGRIWWREKRGWIAHDFLKAP